MIDKIKIWAAANKTTAIIIVVGLLFVAYMGFKKGGWFRKKFGRR